MAYTGIGCPSWCTCSTCTPVPREDKKENIIDGMKQVSISCPKCDTFYTIFEKDMQQNRVKCWNCGESYFQKYQKTSEFDFVRKAIHRTGG